MTNILLVEDDADDARFVEVALRQSFGAPFTMHHVERAHQAMEFLRTNPKVDVILSDITLPDSHGSETFQLLRQTAVNVPVIFITASSDTTMALDAIQKGAQDYLVKGEFSNDFLARVIRYAIERKKYQQEVNSERAKTRALRQKARLLQQQQEQLMLIAKAKDDFISLASHQLRTPATGVKQYLGMVLEGFAGDVPQHLAPFLEKAYESNERQLSIINDLLQVAQLDAGNIKLRRRPTNLAAMLLNIVSEQSAKFGQRRQTLEYQPASPDMTIPVDADRMRMVFDNLIDNASKYTPEGRSVTVGLKQADDGLLVSVRDQGVGIAPEDIAKAFEKFSRVANTRSELVGGSGLGLYWAKQIVDLHGGSIEVHSEVGKGSEFLVYLNSKDGNEEN